MKSTKSGHVIGLDFLRLFAALLVAMTHLWAARPIFGNSLIDIVAGAAGRSTYLPGDTFPRIAFVGVIGVQIFFMISGFVIFQSAERATSGVRFLWQRAARIAPTLWICTMISAVIAVTVGYYSPSEAAMRFLRSAVLLPVGPKIDSVIWTLVLEVTFYGSIAIFLAMKRERFLPAFAWALASAAFAFWVIYWSAGCSGSAGGICSLYAQGVLWKLAEVTLLQHGSFFALGMVFYLAYRAGWSKSRAALALISLTGGTMQIVWVTHEYARHFGSYGATANPDLALGLWVLSLITFAASCRWNDALARSGISRVSRPLGLATYPLYLLHIFVGGIVAAWVTALGSPTMAPIAGITAALILAVVVAQLIEPAARRALTTALGGGRDRPLSTPRSATS